MVKDSVMWRIFGGTRHQNDSAPDPTLHEINRISQRIDDLEKILDSIMASEGRRERHMVALEAEVTDLIDKLGNQLKKFRMREVRAAKKAEKDQGEEGESGQLELVTEQSPQNAKNQLRTRVFGGR